MAGRASPRLGSLLPTSKGGTELNAALTAALRFLVDQLASINTKLETMQTEMRESTGKQERLQQDLLDVKTAVEKNDSRLQKIEKEKSLQSDNVLKLQMDRSNYFLRFQNVPESKGENLKKILSEALAPVTGWQAATIQSDMDMTYRTYPEYVKKKKLPGEIVVRFSKRSTRDVVLKATNGTVLKIQEEEIKVLKDIPFEIRKRRKAYRSLALWLQSETISYRWDIPEGLMFSYKDKKFKIDSIEQARLFLEKHNKKKTETEPDDSLAEQESMYGFESSEIEDGEDSDSKKGAAAPKKKKEKKKGRESKEK